MCRADCGDERLRCCVGAQPPADPLIKESAIARVSDHVHVISDLNVGLVPNVGIIVGTKATLVVDTGLGPRNGQTVLRATNSVSGNAELYVVSTHFHPEHALGESAFPASAKIIRARAQQKDIDEFGLALAKTFASRSPLVAELLEDAELRKADIFFERDYTLDLGGVRVRMLSLGPTHTRGDTIIWVEGDRILFAGDVVMNRTFVAFASLYSSVKAWLADFDQLEPLRPVKVVPSHGPVGDASLIDAQRTMMTAIQSHAIAIVAVLALRTGAVTRLASADGQFWDIQDTSPWSQDSGGIATGGRANPFNGFGYLKLRVRTAGGATLVPHQYLTGFGLAHDGSDRVDSITPILHGHILVARGIFAPKDASYLRYVDSYTNTAKDNRVIDVAWGGAAGAFEDGGPVTVATSSNGDRTIDLSDSFVTVMQNAKHVTDPVRGPSGHDPSAHVLGSHAAGLLTAVGDMYADPFTDRWPGYDPAHIGYVFTLTVKPGQTVVLMTFVVKGLSEVYDPRGGFPIPLRDALVTPKYSAPYAGDAPTIPEAGSEIARVTDAARRLVAAPDVRGLTPLQRSQIVNWRVAGAPAPAATPFAVVEKTVPQIQDALTSGQTTSEDVVREYLARLSLLDRHGPTLRSMLALNPTAIADARKLDAERAASRARGPMHGIPVIFKDNIDVLGLPTTGGSLALVDHRPRLDSRVAAGMRRAGAVMLGKANLDEFPFGDFGISTVGGTIGNAFDPTLSTSGSSGGTATAVATSLATLGFGTDTCNSLSNPASSASCLSVSPASAKRRRRWRPW